MFNSNDTNKTYALLTSFVCAAFAHTSDANETYNEVTNIIMRAEENGDISEQTAYGLIEIADIECESHL